MTSLKLTRNAMVIAESLELAVGPGVQNPVLDAGPGLLSLVLRLVPVGLDLADEVIAAGLGRILGLDALLLQVGVELVGIPVIVGRHNIRVPVLLHQCLELLSVRRGWVGNIVVRKPALKLRLVPLVVSCRGGKKILSAPLIFAFLPFCGVA